MHGIFTPPSLRVLQVITPNGDGKNDYLKITGIESYPTNKIVICDVRTGRIVFKKNNYDNNNGVFNGFGSNRRILVSGTYFMVLRYRDENKLQRTIEKPIYLSRG